MNIQDIQDWMVWAEKYLLWGMILGFGALGMFFIWKSSDDYRSFNKIIHSQDISVPGESVVEVFNLTITGISSGQGNNYYRYITMGGISESAPLDDRIAKLEQSEGVAAIAGLESFPSFLVKEEHKPFWNTQFTLFFILKYGGWIGFCLFVGVFGYLNLKQDDKLLTKEIERLIQGAFFLFLVGYFAFDFLNNRSINFLNDEFQFSASTGILLSYEMNFVLMALLLTYIIIAKAIPVQEEQDLTI